MVKIRFLLIVLGICLVTGVKAQQPEAGASSNQGATETVVNIVNDGLQEKTEVMKSARNYIRKGNKLYADSAFNDAGTEYLRALNVDPKSVEARYNLGNSLLMRQKAEEAMKEFQNAAGLIKTNQWNVAQTAEDKAKLAQIYHNMGVILQGSKQYDACIEAYKLSLRNNPADHETRYNLALAQKMKKEQEQQQQEQQQDQQEQKQDEKKEEQQQQQQQNQQNQQQQEQQEQQQEQQQQQMSQENAEQMLKAIMQDEKDIQEKVKKAMQNVQPRQFEKDW